MLKLILFSCFILSKSSLAATMVFHTDEDLFLRENHILTAYTLETPHFYDEAGQEPYVISKAEDTNRQKAESSPPIDIPLVKENVRDVWPPAMQTKNGFAHQDIRDLIRRMENIEPLICNVKPIKENFFICSSFVDSYNREQVLAIKRLNHSKTYDEAKRFLYEEACNGEWGIIDWLCDPALGANLHKLFPGKSVEEFLLKDAQGQMNESAYEYYFDVIFPEKEQMVTALIGALKHGFSKDSIYYRVMTTLYNDINILPYNEKRIWVAKYEKLQRIAYKMGVVDKIERAFDRATLKGLI